MLRLPGAERDMVARRPEDDADPRLRVLDATEHSHIVNYERRRRCNHLQTRSIENYVQIFERDA